MLLDDFYFIKQQSSQVLEGKTKIEATLSLNKSHPIFAGHFPGQPIVPGVCMVQMVKEIMEVQLTKKLVISSASNLKFLNMLIPNNHIEVNAEILYEEKANRIEIDGRLFAENVTFFKVKGAFTLKGAIKHLD